MEERAKALLKGIEDSLKNQGHYFPDAIIPTAKVIADNYLRTVINEFLRVDEEMLDELIKVPRNTNNEEISARKTWEETVWHKILKKKVNYFRKLREEIKNV